MKLKFDYNNMMADAVGKEGFSEADFAGDAAAIEAAFSDVMEKRGKGWQEWCDLPYRDDASLNDIEQLGGQLKENAGSLVVFGIGGSALGPLCVAYALTHLHHNELDRGARKAPKLYVEDNVDPERMRALLDVIELKDAYFNVVTKSGETSETLSQFLILYDLLKKKLGKAEAKKRIIVTTTVGKGTLYNIAKAEGFKTYGVGPGVGGRFSVLSPVGLVTFAALGIDIRAMLSGAKSMAEACANGDVKKNPALLTGFLQYKAMGKGKNISVMMPYADGLKFMADFYCQLWGESLGKAKNKRGESVYVGQTPVKALGVTDQHSQVQLYTEGPFDKVVTFLAVEAFRDTVVITDDSEVDACDFLKGRTMNELIDAERRATEYALKKAGRLNFTVTLPAVTAETVGELLMYFMYETAFAGALLGIDTFDQPGVEEGKKATFAMLGRAGYEEKMREIERSPKLAKYLI
ncbi:MAG: glucose-6-phosphate isomerase [Clostridiales bacterium]|jgi:glucose-6-phosphate isomerase|nr:glucose-6-phosphate isomerase [Clostridiales bacterium]